MIKSLKSIHLIRIKRFGGNVKRIKITNGKLVFLIEQVEVKLDVQFVIKKKIENLQ